MTKPKTIYIDEHIIVIDKPAGLPSVSLKENEKGTLAAWLIEKYPEQSGIGEKGALEAGLVHRLDNDTSGIIVAARTNEAYKFLKEEFDSERVDKYYLALVLGSIKKAGKIDFPIAHHSKKKMQVAADKKEAQKLKARAALTEFNIKDNYKRGETEYTLLQVRIKKGMRHQIRVHLAYIGHPLAGDRLYQNAKMKAADKTELVHHFLHASKISFKHPATLKKVEFKSSLPAELLNVLSLL